jgi:SSS family solute:Na+ symporter
MHVFPSSWAWGIIIITAILMFGSSWWIYKKSSINSAETFMVANRGVKWGLIAASIAATELWAGSLLAAAEGSYTWGIAGLWMYWLPTPISFMIFAIIAKRVRKLTPTGITIGSFAKMRFGKVGHIVFTLIALWIMILFTMLQIIGGAAFFSGMFDISYNTTAIIIAIVFLGFYLIAGLWSSLVTSFIQYFVVVIILLGIVPIVFFKLGGPGNIYDMAIRNLGDSPEKLDVFRMDAITQYFLVQLFSFGAIATLSNYAWQRAFAVEEDGVTKAMFWGGWSWAPLAMVSSLVGFVGLAIGLNLEYPTDVFPRVIAEVMSTPFTIFLAVAVLFAIYSTGSSYLGGMSSLITSDIYEEYFNKNSTPQQSLKFIRLSSIVISILIVIATIALQKVSLLNAILAAGAFVGAPFFPLVLGLWWKKTSSIAVVIAITTSVILVTIFLFTSIIPQWIAYLSCILLSLILTVIISIIKPDNFDFSELREHN